MAFFNDLGKKITTVAGDAAVKAKDVAEIAKLKTEIAAEQKKIQQGYVELGKIHYEEIKDTATGQEKEICTGIKASLDAIADIEAKIENVKNVSTD